MKLFKNDVEKLEARLIDLEAAALAADSDAAKAGTEAADSTRRLVDALADGLPVADWQKKRDASEEKAASAKRDAAAHRAAIVAVGAKLETARTAERRRNLLGALALAARDGEKATADLRAASVPFAEALARAVEAHGRAERAEKSLLAAEIPTRHQDSENGFDLAGVPYPVGVVQESFARAFPAGPERLTSVRLDVSVPA